MRLTALLKNIPADFIISTSGTLDIPVSGACSDSRLVRPGTLFCAMKGAALDGHDFASDAVARGAAAVICEHPLPLPDSIPQIRLRYPYRALGLIAEAAAGFPARELRLAAVTGTNGKTTTAYLLRDIFRAAALRSGMLGTVEYDTGDGKPRPADRTTPTPFQLQNLLLQMRDNHVDIAALEVSSHALEQQRLGTARCHVAIFTNLTEDHLDYHHDMETYFQAKKLLFTRHLAPDAPAVINADDPYGTRLARELRQPVVTFSSRTDSGIDVRVVRLNLTAHGTSFTLFMPDGTAWDVTTPLTGAYNAANVTGAVIAARALGLPRDTVLSAVAHCTGAPGRMQQIPVPDNLFSVFVDYAHTDDALKNVLLSLRSLHPHALTVLFGCGGDRDRTKRPLMAQATEKYADNVIVTSDNPRTEKPDDIIQDITAGFTGAARVTTIADRHIAIQTAINNACPGDIILLAGKGHEDYQEVNGLKSHFNDAEEAANAIASRFSSSRDSRDS